MGYVNFLEGNYLLSWEPILQARRCWHCFAPGYFGSNPIIPWLHMPWKVHFEDECPFPQVGYVNFLEGNYLLSWEPILQARGFWPCFFARVFWDQTLYTLIATLFARHSKNGKSFIHVIHCSFAHHYRQRPFFERGSQDNKTKLLQNPFSFFWCNAPTSGLTGGLGPVGLDYWDPRKWKGVLRRIPKPPT